MQLILSDIVVKLKNVRQIKRNGGQTQGIVSIGDINQVVASFQEAGQEHNDINFLVYNENPSKFLEYVYELYDQPLQFDKKSSKSKIQIIQDSKDNRNVVKNFFKGFKSTKLDPKNIIVVGNLDDYIETETDFFVVINNIIKDLSKKKLTFVLLLQFKSYESYSKVKQYLNLDLIEFESVFKSKIVSETQKQIIKPKTRSPPQTLEEEEEEEEVVKINSIPKKSVYTVDSLISDKLTKASVIFSEPEIIRENIDENILEKSMSLFSSFLNALQAELTAELSPNAIMIRELETLFDTDIINSNPKRLKIFLEPLEILLQALFKKGANTLGLALPIARIQYKILKIIGDKQKRYEFTKQLSAIFLSFSRDEYASEFFDLSLAISKSKEEGELTAKQYTNMADNTSSKFLEQAYLYKGIAAAYISQNNSLIEKLETRGKKFSKKITPFF